MTAQDIIDKTRQSILGDVKAPYLWENSELVEHLNSAVEDVCEETLLLTDSDDLECCVKYVGIDGDNLAAGTVAGTLKVVTAIDFMCTRIGYSPKQYTIAVQDNIAMTACTQQAVSTYCRYLITVNYQSTVTVTKGVSATTDAGAILPECPSEQTPIGMLLVATDASHTFTSGTTALGATGITATLESSSTTFTTDERVLRVNMGELDNVEGSLEIKDTFWMDRWHKGWKSSATGTPSYIVKKRDLDEYQLWPPSQYPDRLVLTVARTPLTEISEDDLTVSPEIPSRYHRKLQSGIAYYAYQKRDSEAFDADRMVAQGNLWKGTIDKIKQSENRAHQRDETNELPDGVL